MNARFSFYEVVQITGSRSVIRPVEGCLGAILGMARRDDGAWIYAVHVLDQGEVWDFHEHELRSTGQHMVREDFYAGDHVRVEVDIPTRKDRAKKRGS